MNRIRLGHGVLVLALALGAAPLARAQDGGQGRRQRPSLVDQLKEPLGLTDEQEKKVKAIDDDLRAAMQKLFEENQGDRSAIREKMAPLQEKAYAAVRELLTKEQQAKFDDWQKQMAERRAARGQGRGGREEQPDAPPSVPPSKPDRTIELPGASGFDYLRADAPSRKLYVAHSGQIDVVDMDKGEVVGKVEGVDGSHGTAIAADQKRGFATSGRKQKLVVFDTETYQVIKEVATGQGPDAVLYASSVGEAWSINHRGGTVTCVDAKSLEVTSTIQVGGTLEFCAEDPGKAMVYVNVEDQGNVVAIDARKHAVVATYPVGAEEPAGLAIDAKNGLLFVGCGSRKLVIMDAATGKVVSTFDIGAHCDAVAFDDVTGTIFASCGDGTTSVIHEKDARTFEVMKAIGTAPGARTCAVDTKTHKLFVASAPRRGEPGNMKLLVYATAGGAPATKLYY
jgi:DNA-binding beta-propeller fold protein YncE/Spy/CpxP family protein refolding chaperone